MKIEDTLNIGSKFIITYRPFTHDGVERKKLKDNKTNRIQKTKKSPFWILPPLLLTPSLRPYLTTSLPHYVPTSLRPYLTAPLSTSTSLL